MNIIELQKKVDDWIKEYGVRYFDPLTNTVILNEEVGEVCSIIARIYGEQSFKPGKEKDLTDLADEMADVLFVMICLCNQTGIDLEKAIVNNLIKKTIRDKERHKGNNKLS